MRQGEPVTRGFTTIRISRLARILEQVVPPIRDPIVELEQYTTPSETALRVAFDLAYRIPDATIADLGAGTCRLALASLLVGARMVVAVDVDPRFPLQCLRAAEKLGFDGSITYVVSWIEPDRGPLKPGAFDAIVTNPPFGVHRRGADWAILRYAISLKPKLVYAILKSGNLEFHKRVAESLGYEAVRLWTEEFPIPASMAHHRSRIRRVAVDVIRFERISGSRHAPLRA